MGAVIHQRGILVMRDHGEWGKDIGTQPSDPTLQHENEDK